MIQEDTERDGDFVDVFEASEVGEARSRVEGVTSARGACFFGRGRNSCLVSSASSQAKTSSGCTSSGDRRLPCCRRETSFDSSATSIEPGSIVNSNVYVLSEMLRQVGAEPIPYPAAPDVLPDIEAALRKALEADVVITMGGVSVGEYDLVHQRVRERRHRAGRSGRFASSPESR